VYLGIDLSSHDVATVLAGEDGTTLLALRAARPVEGGSPAVWHVAMQTARETLLRGAWSRHKSTVWFWAIDAPLGIDGVVRRGVNTDGWEGFDVSRATRAPGHPDARAENRIVCEALASSFRRITSGWRVLGLRLAVRAHRFHT
jgi:hypothetical protein